jgi:cobalt-zinc-cadmium efflux system membrane fusion protein
VGNWLRNTASTAIVVAALVGLAVWGHSTDWTIPKFSTLVGGETEQTTAWCEEHNVSEESCIECNPRLLPAGPEYGWCAVHGVMQCPLEHPDIAQLKTPATITPAMLARADRALALRSRAENNSLCTLHQRRVQFASVQAIEKVGVDIAIVGEEPVVEAIEANGEVVYDETRMAHLSSRVAGNVWRVEKQMGDSVSKGDVLALIDSAEVGRAKSEFLQALSQLRLKEATVERLRSLAGSVIPEAQFLEAKAAADEARIQLHRSQQALVNLGLPIEIESLAELNTDDLARRMQFLGLPEELVSSLDVRSTTSNLWPLRSSLDGVIVARHVVEGEVVDTREALFDVADISSLWLTLNVRQEDAKYVSPGQTVLFQPSDSERDADIKGTVSWISTAADDVTRTVQIRVDLPNTDGRLRANTFGTGRIVLRDEPKAIVVPSEAVHWDGTCHVVFVRDKKFFQPDAPKFFHVRSVRPGVKEGDMTEIIAGVLPGEVIASKNSTVLEAQLLKSSLGAGCCGSHGHAHYKSRALELPNKTNKPPSSPRRICRRHNAKAAKKAWKFIVFLVVLGALAVGFVRRS